MPHHQPLHKQSTPTVLCEEHKPLPAATRVLQHRKHKQYVKIQAASAVIPEIFPFFVALGKLEAKS